MPVRYADLPRIFTDTAGGVPYVRDVLDFACHNAASRPYEIICFTSTDLCVRSDCALIVASVMQDTDACYCCRRDFSAPFVSPKPDSEIEKGSDLNARDLFAFRVRWWNQNRDKMPDMLLARQSWDPILSTIMDATTPPGTALLHNLTYHHLHNSVWIQHRHTAPSQFHNIRLGVDWCRKHGVDGREWMLP